MEFVIDVCKRAFDMEPKLSPKPICVHDQWNGYSRLPANMDVLIHEYKNHPKDGNERSVESVISETKEVLAALPPHVSLWPQELNLDNEGSIARAQSRAIRELARTEPRIVGLPGPV